MPGPPGAAALYDRMSREELRFLAQAGATLASSFDYRATLAEVARLAVPVLADLCIVDLVDADGAAGRLELAFADRSKAGRLAPFRAAPRRADDASPIDRAMRTKEALLISDCSAAALAAAGGLERTPLMQASDAESMMIVPIITGDGPRGVLTMVAAGSGRRYSEPTLAIAQLLAAQAATAIDNARLYERAQAAIGARDDMLTFVSHDLRNPLMGILLTADIVLRGAHADERRKEWKQLERIRHAAREMGHTIDELLDIVSLDAGRLILDAAAHDVRRLFDDALARLAPLAAEKNVSLSFQPPAAAVTVVCDRQRVVQVLSTLIGNSIAFTPEGGSIVVTAGADAAQALFVVSDSGRAIAPARRVPLFARFWQADETARKARGLGLYIAKGLIEAQGGAIWVDSPGGTGATFSFTLPLAASAAASENASAASPQPA